MNTTELAEKYDEIRSCQIKRTHMNRKEAKLAAKRMNLKNKGDSRRVRAYSCRHCPNYHIGHITEPKNKTIKVQTA